MLHPMPALRPHPAVQWDEVHGRWIRWDDITSTWYTVDDDGRLAEPVVIDLRTP